MHATVPAYEDPLNRFLIGRAKLELADGTAFCLWDAVLFPEEWFPITADNATIPQYLVLVAALELLARNDLTAPFPAEQEVARQFFNEARRFFKETDSLHP